MSSDTSCLLLFYNLSVVIWIKFSIRDFCLLFACFVVYVTTLHVNHGLFSRRNRLLLGFLLQYPHQVAIWTVPEYHEGPTDRSSPAGTLTQLVTQSVGNNYPGSYPLASLLFLG